MTFTVGQRSRSVVVEGDRAWSLALDFAAHEVAYDVAIDRLVDGAQRRVDIIECARALGERRLATHPPDTRHVLRALELLDDALDRVAPR